MGATVPKDGKGRREELSSNDKLRKQLLGKDHEKKMGKRKREDGQVRLGSVLIGSKPRPTPSERQVEEDSEDEPGRSALGKSRHISKEKLAHQSMVGTEDATRQLKEPEQEPLAELSRPHKRTSNYLDEVLADRSRRKHKKANRKAGMAT